MRSRSNTKSVLALTTAVAVLALGGSLTSPAKAATPTNFRVTLTATVTESEPGGCCFSINFFTGNAVLPRIGPATFTGSSIAGCFFTCTRDFGLSFVGANGRQLTISSALGWESGEPMPPLTWTADGSGFTGSGEYSTTPDINQTFPIGTQITINLTGTLLPA